MDEDEEEDEDEERSIDERESVLAVAVDDAAAGVSRSETWIV